ncbi:hypothetical protein [Gemmatimonas sp.]|uniref:hypothetical protein n=1 Tax=Gemmatimonas sp. TaxID=1962908 RepID=UPI0025C45B9C|nr:hypothetical protein [Gemmatimonas sp.]MCA2991653.1 hypothetical protein [Gemmatimonas sp.]
MKTSIDLPDELYRQVKAKSALEGKTVREVATSLFAAYAAGETAPRADDDALARRSRWLQAFQRWGETMAREHPGGGFVDQLQRDRR